MYSTNQSESQDNLQINSKDITKTFNFFSGVIKEIRVNTPAGMLIGYFNNVETLCQQLNEIKYSAVYITINQFDHIPEILNKFVSQKGISDDQISVVKSFFIDVDPIRGSSSASKREKELAQNLANKVLEYLKEFGFTMPMICDSGNGYHLVFALNLAAADHGCVKQFLNILHKKFSNSDVKIDTSVYNLSRVTKLYGTIARKGDNSITRPHRVSSIIHYPANFKIIQKADFDKFIEAHQDIVPKEQKHENKEADIDAVKASIVYMHDFIKNHNIKTLWNTEYNGGWKWMLEACPFCKNTDKCAIISVDHAGRLGFGCRHATQCAGIKNWHDFIGLYQEEFKLKGVKIHEPVANEVKAPPWGDIKHYSRDDLDNLPAPIWIIDKHISNDGTGLVYGQHSTWKSYWTIDAACSMCTGRKFLGLYDVFKTGSVVYILGEGISGIKNRIRAWEIKFNNSEKVKNIHIIAGRDYMKNQQELIDSIKSNIPDTVCIFNDTLGTLFFGEENSSKDMGNLIENRNKLRDQIGCPVWFVAHENKKGGARGSSKLLCDFEHVYHFTGDAEEGIEVKNEKNKDWPRNDEYYLKGEEIILGANEKGQQTAQYVIHPTLPPLSDECLGVLNFMPKGVELKRSEIMLKSGLSKSQINKHLKQLIIHNFIVTLGAANNNKHYMKIKG